MNTANNFIIVTSYLARALYMLREVVQLDICSSINYLFPPSSSLNYEMSINISKGNEFLPQTLTVSPYILSTRCRRPLIFKTMNSVRSNSLKFEISLVYIIWLQRFMRLSKFLELYID